MKNTLLFPMILNLQLFAEGASGGDGGTGAEGTTGATATAAVSQPKGVKSNPLADVKYGIQPTEETTPAAEVVENPTEDRNAKFEALIKGEYKDLYDQKMQDTVQKRLKSTKETVEKYEALAPTLDILAKKYGVDATNIEALNKAIEEDDSFFEEEALRLGVTVEHLKEIRKIQRENAEVKRENAELRMHKEEQERRDNANKIYSQWMEQADKAKQVYPSFDLRAEMQNPKFVDLLRSNIDVRTAYEVIHKDDIIAGAMQFTAKKVEQNLTNKIIANGARPAENGNSSQGASVTKSDVSALTKADRAEIARRVARGEKISFG
jgi:transposase-like protein